MKQVSFEWEGAGYKIDKITARRAVEFFAFQEELAAATSIKEQFETALKMLGALNCPVELIESVGADEVEPLMFAVLAAQMPTPKGQKPDPTGGEGERSAGSLAPQENVSPALPGISEAESNP